MTIPATQERDDIRHRIGAGAVKFFSEHSIQTGPIRIFAFYRPDPFADLVTKVPPKKEAEDTLLSIIRFEQRRGSLLSAEEQPIMVGNFVVQERSDQRRSDFLRWTHLKRGFDWERTYLAAGLAAFSLLTYLIARAVSWVLDGFMSKAEN